MNTKEFKTQVKLFAIDIVRFVDALEQLSSARTLDNQLVRAGTSVGANYFESTAAVSSKDYINYFSIA